MRNRIVLLVGILVLVAVGAAAQMGTGHGMWGMHGRGMMGSQRHAFYMHEGLPPAYAGKSNPRLSAASVLAEGRSLYAQNCASCHGAQGRGDGAMAASLTPPPADLASTLSMPIARDDFLYWTIAEGGAPVGSAMPAFKTVLKPEQIWSIVTALRSGTLEVK